MTSNCFRLLVCAFTCLLLFCFKANGQTLEWARFENITRISIADQKNDISIDSENNAYHLIHGISTKLSPTNKNHVLKYNESGELCWYKSYGFDIEAITCADSCSIYLIATHSEAMQIGQTFYPKPKGVDRGWTIDKGINVLLIKADSSMNILWSRLICDSTLGFRVKEFSTCEEGLLMNGRMDGGGQFKDTYYSAEHMIKDPHLYKSFSTGICAYVAKNEGGNQNEWLVEVYGQYGQAQLASVTDITADDQYAYALLQAGNTYVGDTLLYSKNSVGWIVVRIRLSDGFLDHIEILQESNNYANTISIAATAICAGGNGKLLVAFNYSDSFSFRNLHVDDGSLDVLGSLCCMMLDSNFDPIWHICQDTATKTESPYINNIEHKNGNYYCSGTIGRNQSLASSKTIWFGGFALKNDFNSKIIHYQLFNAKIDSLGNVLWAYSNSSLGSNLGVFFDNESFVVDGNGNPVFIITTHEGIELLGQKLIPETGSNAAIIYKIGDFAIYRGEVFPGPYCAGDSIYIPYQLIGDFEPGNIFTAQLSDEFGKFTGGQRDLGSLTYWKDSVILGIVPLFNVVSSGNYRIRILASKPAVQSYYRQDTLRLLIYSKDSANAGNDTLLCRGQSYQLSTTGGSKWAWSPSVSLNDSSLRQPIATPSEATMYRIIISDSSGCGDTDTDYVFLDLRDPLKLAWVKRQDSACVKEHVQFEVKATGGDSSHYIYSWKFNTKEAISTNKFSVQIDTTSILNVKLEDGCTFVGDSLNTQIHLRPKLQALLQIDSLCFHYQSTLTASGTGGQPASYTYSWKNSNNQLLATGKEYRHSSDTIVMGFVLLEDGCTLNPDSQFFEIAPYPKVKVDYFPSSGCAPLETRLKLTPLNKMVYTHDWFLESNNLGNQEETKWTIESPGIYRVKLSLNTNSRCSLELNQLPAIKVFPTPLADFHLAPEKPDINTDFVQVKNQSQSANQYDWFLPFGQENQLLNPQFVFKDTGWVQIGLIAFNDYCSDTLVKSLFIYDIFTIYMPTAFSPNSDAHNPVFGPVTSGLSHYRMTIYNRWGELIYQSKNSEAWDGTFRGIPCPEGVYIYEIVLFSEKGEMKTLRRSFHLVR